MTYDDALEAAGSFGRYQIQLFVVVFVSAIPNALLFTAIVFLHYVPDHKCSLQHIQEDNITWKNSTNVSLFYPWDEETNSVSKCTIYNVSAENIENVSATIVTKSLKKLSQQTSKLSTDYSNISTINCPSGWVYDNPFGIKSPMMEFEYVCDQSWYTPLMSSLFMFGMLSSTITGPMSDKFGRRPVFLVFTLIQFVVTFLCSFTNGAILYGLLIFLMGFSQMANYISAFILGAEFTTPEKRNFISISSYISFSLGYIIAPGLVFLLPDWRWLLRVNGLIGFLYIPLYWLMPESPRWLIAKKRYKKAEKVLTKIAKYNNKTNNLALIKEEMKKIVKEEQVKSRSSASQMQQFKEMVTSCRMMLIVFTLCLSFFTVSIIYTGFSMSVQALSGNMYLNAALLGAIELPGEVIAYLSVQYISRPLSHGGLMFLTGLSCLSIGLARNANATFTLLASLFGKMCNLAVFYILYVHTTEAPPTLTRNSLMSVGTIVSGCGGMLSPYFVYAVKQYGFFGPYLLIAAITMVSGLLTFFVLPETKGNVLPETVADTLKFKTFFSICCRRAPKSEKRSEEQTTSTELQKLELGL